MTTAERILISLNEYENAAQAGRNDGDIWGDIISRQPLDHEATEVEDPSGRSTVAVFKDGSAVRYVEDRKVWVID